MFSASNQRILLPFAEFEYVQRLAALAALEISVVIAAVDR
jgi:hypothetical protein